MTDALTQSQWLSLLTFASAMAFTPGPNTLLSAAMGANGGWRTAVPFVLGVPVGWGLLLGGSALGLGAAIQALPLLRGLLTTVGLAYLVWLAFKLWQRSDLPQAGSSSAGVASVGFVQGVALQAVNIKAWMNAWLISVGWIIPGDEAGFWGRTAVILPVMMAFGLSSNATYALVGSALRAWLSQGRRLQVFNRSLALVLALTAVWLAVWN
jgi:threonine/homoserine/homoserine lactone efflux protein